MGYNLYIFLCLMSCSASKFEHEDFFSHDESKREMAIRRLTLDEAAQLPNLLFYMAQHDPDSNVRMEAYRNLGFACGISKVDCPEDVVRFIATKLTPVGASVDDAIHALSAIGGPRACHLLVSAYIEFPYNHPSYELLTKKVSTQNRECFEILRSRRDEAPDRIDDAIFRVPPSWL